jgi:YihY family inner membrane protein
MPLTGKSEEVQAVDSTAVRPDRTAAGSGGGSSADSGGGSSADSGRRLSRRRRVGSVLRRFWRIAWDSNITGQASMVAYTMLLGLIPVALLALFIGGKVLSAADIQQSVLGDLREVFPGSHEHTLNQLLSEIRDSTTSTGILALIASLWLGSSFWGALDTAFARIYGCRSRPWLEQKRFGIAMLGVVIVFMIATVAVPTAQSLLKAGAAQLPFDLAHVAPFVYAASIGVSALLLFGCLTLIYSRVPNRSLPWRAVWPGAVAATGAIVVVAYAFPLYLSSISTIARFGTTIVFVLIMLGWFYVVAIVILGGACLNALRIGADRKALPASPQDRLRDSRDC